jgi:hypothetical protein
MFCRNLGSALGVAAFGAIANATLADRFAHPTANVAGRLPNSSDSESLVLGGHLHGGPVGDFVRSALYDAAHNVFLGGVAAAVVGFLVLWLMPRHTRPIDTP